MSSSGKTRRGKRASRKVLREEPSPNLSTRGIVPSAEVTLLYNESDDRSRVPVATGTLFGTAEGTLSSINHGHDVRPLQHPDHDVVLV